MDRLTKKQRVLKREIDEIVDLMGIEFDDIGFVSREWRTPHLERVKDHLIRSSVVLEYTLIDEYLDSLICYYIFGTKKSFISYNSGKHRGSETSITSFWNEVEWQEFLEPQSSQEES